MFSLNSGFWCHPMRLDLTGGKDMPDRMTMSGQEVAYDSAVALPEQAFRAHIGCEFPLSNGQQFVNALLERLRLHVVGVVVKTVISQS